MRLRTVADEGCGSTSMGSNSARAIQHCIRVCLETRRVCLDTVVHCLEKGGKHAEIERIRLLLECADKAWLDSQSMEKHSSADREAEAACTRLCIDCARACETGTVDEVLTNCAAACWRCASTCSALAA
jgi:hypothetical protein